jgi:hypothetical protein
MVRGCSRVAVGILGRIPFVDLESVSAKTIWFDEIRNARKRAVWTHRGNKVDFSDFPAFNVRQIGHWIDKELEEGVAGVNPLLNRDHQPLPERDVRQENGPDLASSPEPNETTNVILGEM